MKRKELQKYNFMYLMKYGAAAFFYPFFSLFLESTGKNVREISIILMFVPLVAVVVNPMWNYFIKDLNHNKLFIVVFSLIESLLIFLLIFFLNFYVVALIAGLMSVVNQPSTSMMEGYTTIYSIQANKKYSNIRMFGAFGYAMAVLVAGYLIEKTGYNITFSIASGLLILASIVIFFIKPLDLTEEESNRKGSLKELFTNKNFIIFLIYYVIVFAILFGGEAYWGLYFKHRGYTEKTFGFNSFIAYGFEAILLIFLARYGDKFKVGTIMATIVIALFLRYLIFALNMPLYMLYINSLIRAYVMAAMLYIIVRYLGLYVKKYNITLALIVADSSKNLLQTFVARAGGFVIEEYSYNTFFLILSITALLALFFVKYRQDPNEYVIMQQELNK